VTPSQCLLVGDNLESDTAGARSVGMRAALVLTGVSTRADIVRSGIQPTWVVRDLPELVDRLMT
jgi:ribonucleotide monophosphatase NagD (HAD superfamily)